MRNREAILKTRQRRKDTYKSGVPSFPLSPNIASHKITAMSKANVPILPALGLKTV